METRHKVAKEGEEKKEICFKREDVNSQSEMLAVFRKEKSP